MKNKNEIVVIYKEVGKKPELKKIQNELNTFKNLIGGELDYIQYKDITIDIEILRNDYKRVIKKFNRLAKKYTKIKNIVDNTINKAEEMQITTTRKL